MRANKISISCFCFLAAAIMCAFGANAQNRSMKFIAQMSFGQVNYLSPSNISMFVPNENPVPSLGMEVNFGVRFKDRLTTKIGFAYLGGTVNYSNTITRENIGMYYANFEIGYDFRVKSWLVSPSIGLGYLGYSYNHIIQNQGHTFSGSGMGSDVGLSVAYYFNEHFAVRASAGAVFGSVVSLKANQNDEVSFDVLDNFNQVGDLPVTTSRFSLGIELSL